jgi:hypothetical protein
VTPSSTLLAGACADSPAGASGGPAAPRLTLAGTLIASWAVLGVGALLVQALVRLAPMAWAPIRDGSLTPLQWALYLGWVVINAHAEGYRGFQQRFAPRVVARAWALGAAESRSGRWWPLHVVLAPPFAMSLFHATRRGRIVAWSVVIGVAVLVVLVRRLDQPWRGIVDGGVVVGLGWGTVAMFVFYARALLGRPPAIDPDLPER